MKILHIVPSYKPAYIYGGTITAVAGLCESEAQLGHEILVFTTTANGKEELAVLMDEPQCVDGVKVHYFKRITKDHTHFSPTLLIALWKIAKKVDAIHIHSWWNLVTMPAVFICWLRGVKPFFSPHGMLSNYSLENRKSGVKALFHKSIGRFLLRQTILHATSQQEAQEGRKLIPNWRYILAFNIVELPPLKNYRADGSNSIFKLVFLSRIHPKKGIELLFEALSLVEFPFLLQIAGKGDDSYEASLKKLVVQYQLTDSIVWLGWLNGEEKYRLLAEADLFVLPSFNENFAMVVVEALAVGTPVLLSDQVGLKQYVLEHQFGRICRPEVNHLMEQLVSIQRNEQARNDIRRRAIPQIYEDFSPTIIAESYVDAYKRETNIK